METFASSKLLLYIKWQDNDEESSGLSAIALISSFREPSSILTIVWFWTSGHSLHACLAHEP